MKAYVFPGQGAQFTGMGKDLYENSPLAKELFEKANEILGFRITDIMFEGTAEELKETKVTQPAVFLHSVILAKTLGDKFKAALSKHPVRAASLQNIWARYADDLDDRIESRIRSITGDNGNSNILDTNKDFLIKTYPNLIALMLYYK